MIYPCHSSWLLPLEVTSSTRPDDQNLSHSSWGNSHQRQHLILDVTTKSVLDFQEILKVRKTLIGLYFIQSSLVWRLHLLVKLPQAALGCDSSFLHFPRFLFYFGLVLAITHGMQDPSSLTRNQTSGLQRKHGVSTIGPPEANFPWF